MFSHPNPMDSCNASYTEKHKLEGSVFSGRQMMSTMMILYGGQIAVGDWSYI